jgi:PKD repeat protein
MTGDSGNLSIDFLVGFTIFLLAFIWVISMIPGLLINLQGYTIDYDAVAYRTGVILAEDPGEPALPSFPWEILSKKDVVRFGLAISKNTPNILSRNKVDKFFCLSVFSYPDDYQQRAIFGDYPYTFNISLTDSGKNMTQSVGDIMYGNYGSIRRLVKIKEPSHATINASYDITAHPDYFSGENETQHEFSIRFNNTELLKDKVRDPVFQIDPAREKITINITHLNETMAGEYLNRNNCFNINLTKIYAKDQAFVRIQLFTEPVIDNIQYHDINTEGMYATLPSVNNNISLTFDPNFIPWSNYPQVYITLTFNLVKNASAPAYCSVYNGSRFFNNSLTSAFDYNYISDSVTQPELRDGVLEVDIRSGYRTISETLIELIAAKYKYEIQSGAPTFTVKFTDQSTGSPVEWDWDYGDGTPHGTTNNPTHNYPAQNIYTVTLIVKDAAGVSASITKTVDLSAPVAGFSGIPVSGNEPLNVQFTDTSTGGAPSSWKWEYNKTSSGGWTQFSTSQNPLNTFTEGTYDIRLTATNLFGFNTSTKYSYITATIPITAIGAITGTPQVGSIMTAGALTPAGATASYQWQRATTSGGTYTAIAGATATTYTPVAGDGGYYIKVVATGTGSYAGTVTSAYVGPVTIIPTTQTFNANGTSTVPQGAISVDYCVVGGGGGGGRYGGGGGAGGFRTGTLTGLSSSYAVTVGGEGLGATGAAQGASGGISEFASIISAGGGGGGSSSGTLAIRTGANGGSGGGGIRATTNGGTGNTPPVAPSQGNDGGAGSTSGGVYYGGGGGGAGGSGIAAIGSVAGNGGAGSICAINGVTYAGGGGGGSNSAGTAGGAGSGGGGAGGDGAAGTIGTANTGGGGGGGGSGPRNGGNGGSGIVIVRYY